MVDFKFSVEYIFAMGYQHIETVWKELVKIKQQYIFVTSQY